MKFFHPYTFIVLVFCSIFSSALLAVPAIPVLLEIAQPDGTTFQARLRGDEWFNWLETTEQQVVVQNETTGYFEYAVIKQEGSEEKLAPSGIIVQQSNSGKNLSQMLPERITRDDLKRLRKAAVEKHGQISEQ